ncbi:unnamed protein product [Pleuronectes platessa]|uniref:Uncharacterized protein n=1 Tax=Pleuronectes platessa TaxID=8262 RepID=A0A9N7VE42_PLEPL|nr:unnamed protein product [Pleuronectes platessa]
MDRVSHRAPAVKAELVRAPFSWDCEEDPGKPACYQKSARTEEEEEEEEENEEEEEEEEEEEVSCRVVSFDSS